jgi:hypothetical protein
MLFELGLLGFRNFSILHVATLQEVGVGKKISNKAIVEAERMIESATGTAFSSLEEMTPAQRSRLTTVGTQALYFASIAKALEAIRNIDIEKIPMNSRPIAAGILVDKVEKLARLLGQSSEERIDVTRHTVEEILGSVKERATSIRAAGIRIELGPEAVASSYQAPGPTEGAVIEAPVDQEEPPEPTAPDPDAWPEGVPGMPERSNRSAPE